MVLECKGHRGGLTALSPCPRSMPASNLSPPPDYQARGNEGCKQASTWPSSMPEGAAVWPPGSWVSLCCFPCRLATQCNSTTNSAQRPGLLPGAPLNAIKWGQDDIDSPGWDFLPPTMSIGGGRQPTVVGSREHSGQWGCSIPVSQPYTRLYGIMLQVGTFHCLELYAKIGRLFMYSTYIVLFVCQIRGLKADVLPQKSGIITIYSPAPNQRNVS